MKNIILILFCISIILSCKMAIKANRIYHSELLSIERIGNNIFQHTSYLKTESFGLVPCNGLVFINGKEAIVFDTPVDNKSSEELIQWIGDKKIKAVVVTHFHIDCLGGLGAFHSKKIDSYALNKTIQLAIDKGEQELPINSFDSHIEFKVGQETAIAKYFGEGHTADNIVGYIPSEKTLFGGCLIKALNSSKGNLEDANTKEWSSTVKRIKKEYQNIKIVVPGHGNHGGSELLDYTINLFQQ